MSDESSQGEKTGTGAPKLTRKENITHAVKFFLFSTSAGIIQVISFTVLNESGVFRDAGNPYGPSYFIALVLSVVWNFTFNRTFTFKSAANYPLAMLKVFGYYVVFTPASVWWGNAITGKFPGMDWVNYVVLGGTMIINLITEFIFQRFVVFGSSINTAVKKDAPKDDAAA